MPTGKKLSAMTTVTPASGDTFPFHDDSAATPAAKNVVAEFDDLASSILGKRESIASEAAAKAGTSTSRAGWTAERIHQAGASKGSDVASAATLSLGSGNYFDVTGTTTITGIAGVREGYRCILQFDSALTLTHHATSFKLPTGGNITTAAGDHAEFIEYSSGNWRCVFYQRADGSSTSTAPGVLTSILDTNGYQVRNSKGADVPSQTTIAPGTDGNYFDIIGTSSIEGIEPLGVGTEISLHFDNSLTLTHHSTNFILPGGSNITTVAGDHAVFVEYVAERWRCKYYQRATGQALAAGASSAEIVTDVTPQWGGTMDSNGKQLRLSKGADVASATPLAIGDDGNYFEVTGTTTIATIASKAIGTEIVLQFADVLTLTHSADLELPNDGSDIATAAGDRATFVEIANGDWICTHYQRADGSALASGGGVMADLVDDTTPQFGGIVDTNGNQVRWSKGTDVASSSTLGIGNDGNYFDVTGATAITAIAAKAVGTLIKLHFDGALTLTHHATNLSLPGGANITTAAGDEFEFVEYASGAWRCTGYALASGEPIGGAAGDATEVTMAVNQTSHGFSSGDPIQKTGISWSATFTEDHNLVGIVSTVVDTDNFIVTIHGPAPSKGSLAAGGLTAGEAVFLKNDSTTYTDDWTRHQVGYMIDASTIFVDPVYRPAGTVIYRTPPDDEEYDPSVVQQFTTTYAELSGSSINYTPKGSSTTSQVRFVAQFHVSTKSLTDGLLFHHKTQLDGSDQTESQATHAIAPNQTAGGELTVNYAHTVDAWAGAKTLRLVVREYGTNYQSRAFASIYFDGTVNTALRRAYFRIEEILL